MKLYFLLAFSLVFFTFPCELLAQKDVAATDFVEFGSAESYDGKSEIRQSIIWAGLAFENVGDPLSSSDQILLRLFIDGTEAFYGHGPVLVDGPAATGQKGSDFDYYYFEEFELGPHEVCVVAQLDGDSNTANDTACVQLTLIPPSIDLLSFSLIGPIVGEDGDVQAGTDFKRLRLQIRNNTGNYYYGQSYKNGDLGIGVKIEVEGGTTDTTLYNMYFGTLGTQPLLPFQTVQADLRSDTDYPFPQFPEGSGPFNICLSPIISDNAGEAEALCQGYNLVGGLGIAEAQTSGVKLFMRHGQLHLSDTSWAADAALSIFDMSGKLVHQQWVQQADGDITLPITPGLYIVHYKGVSQLIEY